MTAWPRWRLATAVLLLSLKSQDGTAQAQSPRPFSRRILDFISYTTPEMIKVEGYPVEVHHPVTEDGYILEMHRIPHGVKGARAKGGKRPVVFLQHGLMSSSSFWVMNTPDKALAYILADHGYDVWMNNIRGNVYTRSHKTLSPDDEMFWEFSFDEMGKYDMPASIDYVLNVTKQDKLKYIGFSMGTTVFFTMLHHNPQYNDKINVMLSIAPSAYLYFNSSMKTMIKSAIVYQNWLSATGRKEMFANCMVGQKSNICPSPWMGGIFQTFMGSNPNNFTKEYVPVIFSHYPAGTSLRNLLHYQQLVLTGQFRRYHFGVEENLKRYGSAMPPAYNLRNVETPMIIFYSEKDTVVPPQGVRMLLRSLRSVVKLHHLRYFSHEDFGSAKLAAPVVYKHLLRYLKKF